MAGALAVLLLCQLAGEIIIRLTGLTVPGPVVGMALLFGWLIWRGQISAPLEQAAGGLLRVLSLLFVPAGVGIVAHLDRLREALAPVAAAVLAGTLLTIAVTGLVMQALLRREKGGQDGCSVD